MMRPLPLHISPPARGRIRELARAAWPQEACGLLEGIPCGTGGRVCRVIRAVNVHPQPRQRYEIDPETVLFAERAARMAGRTVIGVWHSHPDGSSRPSATDVALAAAGWSYLIAGVTTGVDGLVTLRCWRIHAGQSIEQEMRVTP